MNMEYRCEECGRERVVENPMTARITCVCGKTMRATGRGAAKHRSRIAPQVAQEETSLMGAAWRGEMR